VLFGWDNRKSDRNLEDRGFDFEFATQIFDGRTLEREDTRRDYGERRVIAIGVADGIALTVVLHGPNRDRRRGDSTHYLGSKESSS